MRHFILVTPALALMIASISLAALAHPNLVENPGAESGIDSWTQTLGTPVSAPCTLGDITFVASGQYAFSMDICDTTAGLFDGSEYVAQLSQTVDTTGCNFNPGAGDLSGEFRYGTQYQTHEGNHATMGITFLDDGANELASTNRVIPSPNGLPKFRSAGISGVIPANASEAVLTIGGKGEPASDMTPGAYHDDVSYNFTRCVAAYARTSGKTACTGGNTSSGGGSGNGQFTVIADCDDDNGTQDTTIFGPSGGEVLFEDAVFITANLGLLEGSGTGDPETFPYSGTAATGSYIFFNSKKPSVQSWCMLTPGEGALLTINADGWSIGDGWNGHCEELRGDTIEGAWNLLTYAENPPANAGKGRDKQRGVFHLDDPDDEADPIDWTLVRGSGSTGEVK